MEITVDIPQGIFVWLDENVKKEVFQSESHAVMVGLKLLKDSGEKDLKEIVEIAREALKDE